jgi:hypothetical protein
MTEIIVTDDDAGIGEPLPVRDSALRYASRGWSVIPVPHQSKNPGRHGWEQLRLTPETIPQHFNGKPQNIGVLLGEPSGWVIDIDLDHPRAVALAKDFLPPTPARFGRPSKQESHWLYRVSRPAPTKKFKSKSAGMIVEFRSTGMQTVFPPSVHESGEEIAWVEPGAEPATVDPETLLECVERLANTVKVELGEKAAPKAKERPAKPTRKHVEGSGEPVKADVAPANRSARCVTAMLKIGVTDHKDGSHRLFVAACRAVEHDLDDPAALEAIREYARQRPFPGQWSDEDVLRRLRDAERQCERGAALAEDADGCIPLGQRDPESGRLVLSSKRTLPTAHAYVREFHTHPGGRSIHCYAGLLMEWRDNRYVEAEENAVKHRLQPWLHQALRYIFNRKTETLELVDFESNPGTVKSALDTIQAFTHLPAKREVPLLAHRASRWCGGVRDLAMPLHTTAPADDAALPADAVLLLRQCPRD